MLSTFADPATPSRFSLILYLFIALLVRTTASQDTQTEHTINATDTSFIIYQPTFDDPSRRWNVDSANSQLPVVSTNHHNASLHFQFQGKRTTNFLVMITKLVS